MSVLLSSLEGIIIIVQNFIAAIGYPGIFALMLLEGLLIPVPSEVVLAFGGYLALTGALPPYIGIPAYILVLLAGSIGNLVGALIARCIIKHTSLAGLLPISHCRCSLLPVIVSPVDKPCKHKNESSDGDIGVLIKE